MRQTGILILAVILLATGMTGCNSSSNKVPALVPVPVKMEISGGNNTFGPGIMLSVPASFREEGDIFIHQVMETLPGLELKIGTEDADITFSIDSAAGSPGAYTLVTDRDRCYISAPDEAGLFHASQTLLQLLMQYAGTDGNVVLPEQKIDDAPAFSWRGMHLDVSRHFFPVEFIKKYIDILAFYRMNTFHWHLTDDQGWRIEIDAYPKLTEVGAYREDTRDRPWSYDQFPVREDRPVYGGYYTKEEIREVIAYAAARHVTIVPEIELPGHSWAALYAYPSLSCSEEPFFKDPSVPFEFSDPFCAGKEETFTFFEAVLDEVIELFPSEYIHIGGDEAKKTPWEHCEECQARIISEGLEGVEELQSYFISRIDKYVTSKGRTIIGWDEILEGGLAENAAVMSWRGIEGGAEAAKMHHPVVMTPGSYTYLNRNQDITDAEKSNVLTLKQVYSFNPVPEELNREEKKYILGLQGCLWTENVQTTAQAEFQLLPRLLAIAETGWSGQDRKDYTGFLERLETQFRMLDMLGYNYFVEPPRGLRPYNAFISDATLELSNPLGFGTIYYTDDGTTPGTDANIYSGPIQLSDTTAIKTILDPGTDRTSRIVTGAFVKKTPINGMDGTFTKGLKVQYLEGGITTLDDLPVLRLIRTDTIDRIHIPAYTREDAYALEFSGYIKINETAIYTFATNSDDGTRLYLDDRLLIDNDGVHGPVRVTGQVALGAGYHPFRLEFFEGNYGQILEFTVLEDGRDVTDALSFFLESR